MFAIVKRYYDRGIYNEKAVAKFVSANMLTAEEYKQITGIKSLPQQKNRRRHV